MSEAAQYQIAIGAMGLLITGLFAYLRIVDARQQKQIKWLVGKWDECEADRKELWKELLDQAKAQRDLALRLSENFNRGSG